MARTSAPDLLARMSFVLSNNCTTMSVLLSIAAPELQMSRCRSAIVDDSESRIMIAGENMGCTASVVLNHDDYGSSLLFQFHAVGTLFRGACLRHGINALVLFRRCSRRQNELNAPSMCPKLSRVGLLYRIQPPFSVGSTTYPVAIFGVLSAFTMHPQPTGHKQSLYGTLRATRAQVPLRSRNVSL